MLYSLLMIISINGQADAYVLDHGLTRSDCVSVLPHKAILHRARGVVAVASFTCKAEVR